MVIGFMKADSFRLIMNFVFPIATAIGFVYCFACGIRMVRAEGTERADHEKKRFLTIVIAFVFIFLLLLVAFLLSRFLPLDGGNAAEAERKTAEIRKLRIQGK